MNLNFHIGKIKYFKMYIYISNITRFYKKIIASQDYLGRHNFCHLALIEFFIFLEN